MTGELEVFTPRGLGEQMEYAKLLAKANLLPKQYREQPANLLLAMAYGSSLGLSVSQVLTSVNVVEGKPSMGAELMQALGRKAGHRIRVGGNDEAAYCSVWRSDDPEFEYRAEWTIERAVLAKLCTRDANGRPHARSRDGNPLPWELYPAAMLRARAVSEACRMAIPDVLAGVSYVQEELTPQYVDATPSAPVPAALAAAGGSTGPQPKGQQTSSQAPASADVVESAAEPAAANPDVSGHLEQMDRELWVADWQGRLGDAIETGDFALINELATAAARQGETDLREDAVNAWHIVSGRAAAAQHAAGLPDPDADTS